jgi:putative membrane protein
MENVRFILKSWLLILVIASTAVIAAAMQTSPDQSANVDREFITKSTQGSLAEVELGKIALQKSQNPEVRQFAQKMIDDHTKLIEDMKPAASHIGSRMPTRVNAKQRQEAERLQGLSGSDFDKAYITTMVADHHQDLNEFTEEESRTTDPNLKDTVTKGKEVIRMHTEMIDEIARKNGIQTPGTTT